jgi:hypothetical protein
MRNGNHGVGKDRIWPVNGYEWEMQVRINLCYMYSSSLISPIQHIQHRLQQDLAATDFGVTETSIFRNVGVPRYSSAPVFQCNWYSSNCLHILSSSLIEPMLVSLKCGALATPLSSSV